MGKDSPLQADASSAADQRPTLYRWRFTNWLMAQPWRWHFRTLYGTYRHEQRHPDTGKLYAPAYGRLRAAWLALSFPHVHHDSEYGDEEDA